MKKRKLISILTTLTMLSSGAVPVIAEDFITVGGEVLYFQNFEGTVEDEMTTVIGGATAFNVETIDGNKVLKVDSASAYGYNKFGAEDWVTGIECRCGFRGYEIGKKYAEAFEILRLEMGFGAQCNIL